MKKQYEKPVALVASLDFGEHILASGAYVCVEDPDSNKWTNTGDEHCEDSSVHFR